MYRLPIVVFSPHVPSIRVCTGFLWWYSHPMSHLLGYVQASYSFILTPCPSVSLAIIVEISVTHNVNNPYCFNYFMSLAVLIGEPVSPSFLPFRKGGSEGPHGGFRSGEISFLWESHCVCRLGARTGQTAHPSLWNSGIIQIVI